MDTLKAVVQGTAAARTGYLAGEERGRDKQRAQAQQDAAVKRQSRLDELQQARLDAAMRADGYVPDAEKGPNEQTLLSGDQIGAITDVATGGVGAPTFGAPPAKAPRYGASVGGYSYDNAGPKSRIDALKIMRDQAQVDALRRPKPAAPVRWVDHETPTGVVQINPVTGEVRQPTRGGAPVMGRPRATPATDGPALTPKRRADYIKERMRAYMTPKQDKYGDPVPDTGLPRTTAAARAAADWRAYEQALRGGSAGTARHPDPTHRPAGRGSVNEGDAPGDVDLSADPPETAATSTTSAVPDEWLAHADENPEYAAYLRSMGVTS